MFHDYMYIPVYKIWIQCTNLFKRDWTETIYPSWKRAITPIIIGGFYPKSNLTYILWKYLVIKYESNTLIFLKDIEHKPFFLCTEERTRQMDGTYGQYVCMDKGDTICNPPPPPPPNTHTLKVVGALQISQVCPQLNLPRQCLRLTNLLSFFFSYISQKTGSVNSCILPPNEIMCMKFQTLFSE